MSESALIETVTLGRVEALLPTLASTQSVLLLAPPGVGKSETVQAAARTAYGPTAVGQGPP